jgi:hypothetical protein
MTSDNVSQFPTKPRPKPEDDTRFLIVEDSGCAHTRGFKINEKEECVTCRDCGVRLSPMYALKLMSTQETQWHKTRALYQEEMKRLDERRKTTCEHCNRITTIPKPQR